ncbi:dihydrodipicolinate synthase family protein [Aeoliella sp.]|uniref:dihydrodipicolinate synthase family protein n=1 Tax=Aeoliella sp. TaxID=2795800 RepID=UPI003CCBD0E3
MSDVFEALQNGLVIPAHPLALTATRQLDERRQRGLSRYYLASGAGGLAVGVHTTQFEIHDPQVGLLEPVLMLAAEEMDRAEQTGGKRLVRVAGICGDTPQATREASTARDLRYDLGLVSLAAVEDKSVAGLLAHCRAVAEILPVFGFYLQPSVGGIELPVEFWRGFCEIENAKAIKVAAFDRYRTLDVLRAVAESGRSDMALYTGNDDNILLDLLTPYEFDVAGERKQVRFVGGLLGQWAVWTHRAVELLQQCHDAVNARSLEPQWLKLAAELTDANGAIFDVHNRFHGCISGIHEVLRRHGLMEQTCCLSAEECLSPGQMEQLDRIWAAYPHLRDDAFVDQHRDEWLRG